MPAQLLARQEILQSLEPLLRKYGRSGVVISEATPLYEGGSWIGGDDASEFLDEIGKKFGTRFDDLKWSDYFPGENEDMGIGFVRLLERLFHFRTSRRKVFTVGHLINVIQKGDWFSPEI